MSTLISAFTTRKEYVPLQLTREEDSSIRVMIRFEGKEIDITHDEAFVGLDPVAVLVAGIHLPEQCELILFHHSRKVGAITCFRADTFILNGVEHTLLHAKNLLQSFVGPLARLVFWLRFYRKGRGVPYQRYWLLASHYFVPVKVILVSVKCGDFEAMFPMDLQANLKTSGLQALGLRNTNKACQHLNEADFRILIMQVPESRKDVVYQLGRYHTENFPAPDELPFKTYRSGIHQNLVADFACSCTEFKLVTHFSIGWHQLIMLQPLNTAAIKDDCTPLAHIHSLA